MSFDNDHRKLGSANITLSDILDVDLERQLRETERLSIEKSIRKETAERNASGLEIRVPCPTPIGEESDESDSYDSADYQFIQSINTTRYVEVFKMKELILKCIFRA